MTKLKIALALTSALVLLTGCYGTLDSAAKKSPRRSAHINDTTKFSSRAYGVAASPRVTRGRNVRKGGGRRQIGKPYKIRGKWYRPREEPGYDKTGKASWYGPNFHGRLTANGEVYDQYALSGAHPTFPLPSYARVTNVANGHSVIIRINDRGPYHGGRIIDLSSKAADLLDYKRAGTATVRVQYIGQAPLHGRDEAYLSASYKQNGSRVFASRSVKRPAVSPAPVLSYQRSGPRPKGSIRALKLDTFSTGSTTAVTEEPIDPFLNELDALSEKKDTGTTLALRFKRLFKEKNPTSGQ